MMHAPMLHTHTAPGGSSPSMSNGGRLVTTSGRALPLLGATLAADAAGGVARVTVRQRFKNVHAEPLAVTYSLPLPADGAVSGFSFTIGERRVVGEIDRRSQARERYEQALVEGRTAALLEQDRSSLFTQEIGNIPPGEEVLVEIAIDQRLRWLDEGSWEWRFPTVVQPRYLGEAGRVPDASRVYQEVSDGPTSAKVALSVCIRDALSDGAKPESPSHATVARTEGQAMRVELQPEGGAALDRDVVVRWRVIAPKVGLSLDTGRAGAGRAIARHAHGLLTIVPPSRAAAPRPVPRDLIVLLDTSGSMSGEPLAQAVRVTSALVSTLRDEDQLELIEFSSAPRRWKAAPVAASEKARREALAWLSNLRASGSTEMRSGIVEALKSVRGDAQRQVVLITDGAIGFESEVVKEICDRLPAGSRVHTVGVGSAVNRSLTGAAARAGRGVEVIIGLGEDPERAAARIVARTNAPLVVGLELAGSALAGHAPAKLPDLFAGAPALVGLALRPEGGELAVRGVTRDGTWEERLHVAPLEPGQGNAAVVALYGRESVEDLEMRLCAGAEAATIDAAIESTGVDFQISTRLTSWVAVSEEATVDPGKPLRRERMPQELPHGVSAEGLGLRAPAMRVRGGMALAGAAGAGVPPSASSRAFAGMPPQAPPAPGMRMAKRAQGVMGAIRGFFTGDKPDEGAPSPEKARVQSEARAEAAPAPTLRGRIALVRGTEVVVEVFAGSEALEWAPPAEARVTLEDGRVVTARVGAVRTTARTNVPAGAAVRLALELPSGETAKIRRVEIDLDGATVLIEIE